MDGGPVHNGQHLLGDAFGGGQHPGAKARGGDDGFGDLCHGGGSFLHRGVSKNSKLLANSTETSVYCVKNARNTYSIPVLFALHPLAFSEFPGGFPFSETP
ncbi:hypothetical protein SDC9_203529 [bioreactor metagenome]|uniref:Uncharacterized protein n=1 Tax=bioreactor metagenome TaxID=1076179 RepID=A0A645IWN0_9ZZZZ